MKLCCICQDPLRENERNYQLVPFAYRIRYGRFQFKKTGCANNERVKEIYFCENCISSFLPQDILAGYIDY